MKHNNLYSGPCIVCSSNLLEPLTKFYRFKNKPKFRYVFICKDCGHIQLNPMEIRNTIKDINNDFFTEKYRPGLIEENNKKKLSKFVDRLEWKLDREGGNALEVGPGSGFLLDYLLEKNFSYYFIESIEKFRKNLISKGGINVTNDLFSFDSAIEEKFDLIVLRHVIEHLDRPELSLQILNKYLKPEGMLYMALPNGIRINNISKGFRTSFLRDPHLSYFSTMNIMRIIRSVGLTIVDEETDGELYFLLKKGPLDFEWKNEYQSNKNTYHQLLKESFNLDLKNILLNEIKRPARWMMKITKH